MITAKTGNYLVFLPSYTFLKQVIVAFNQAYPHVDTIIQETNMTRIQQEEFLKQFVSNPSKVLLGFAVLGGSFAEGIDLKTGANLWFQSGVKPAKLTYLFLP